MCFGSVSSNNRICGERGPQPDLRRKGTSTCPAMDDTPSFEPDHNNKIVTSSRYLSLLDNYGVRTTDKCVFDDLSGLVLLETIETATLNDKKSVKISHLNLINLNV